MTDFKLVPLSEIHPDPNQPRKYFDEVAMAELTMSVSEKGILQPILIRPNGDGHLLVCGERRYRAATAAGLTEVPCVIRLLTDDEALELQIIENLQRKDVHPMEEAVAFKSLLDAGKDIKEIAARIGKSDFYARQRIKLCSLSKDWQQVFFANRLSVTDALKLSLFDEKIQGNLYQQYGDRNGPIEINDWWFREYRGDLKTASFDLADPTLDRKMGPCTTCQFSSAVSSLFPEDAITPKCMLISCFKHKSDVHFDHAFTAAKQDPEVIFIDDSYRDNEAKKIIEDLKKEGLPIFKQYDDYTRVEAPSLPDADDYMDDDAVDFSDDDARAKYVTAMDRYEKMNTAYQKKISAGKSKKAFAISGNDKGKFVYVDLKTNANSKSSKAAVESGDATLVDIESEISRIQDRNKRSIELDGEKVHAKIVEQLKVHPYMKEPSLEMDKAHRKIMLFLIHESLPYSIDRKLIGISDSPYNSSLEDQKAWFQKLDRVLDSQLALMLRKIALDKFSTSLPQHSGGASLRILAETFPDIDIASIEAEQAAIAARRQVKIDKRLVELKEQMETLAKAAPAKKSKTSKKVKS